MRHLRTTALLLTLCLTPVLCEAATPAPKPARIDITKVQPKALLPKTKLHTEFTVETNKLGQVTRVRKISKSSSDSYNAQTYGNALQSFIRTAEGGAIAGTYKLIYDYNPKTAKVRRDVVLVHAGGVNENARGAALDMLSKAHPRPGPSAAARAPVPAPGPSINNARLPDLNAIMKPTPTPH